MERESQQMRNEPAASSSQNSSKGDLAASSFQNSLTGSVVASSFRNSMTGGCGGGGGVRVGTSSISYDDQVVLRVERRFCHHCDEYLFLKTYKRHKRLYYIPSSGLWVRKDSSSGIDATGNTGDESAPFSFGERLESNEDDEPPHSDYEMLIEEGECDITQEEYTTLAVEDDCIEYWDESSEEDCDQHLEVPPSLNGYHRTPGNEEKRALSLAKWVVAFIFHLRKNCALSDNGTKALLHFFVVLFGVIGKIFQPLSLVHKYLPKSLYSLQSSYGASKVFSQYVVCRKCSNVYSFDDCKQNKFCAYIRFPNHPQLRMRMACNSILLKTVELSSGKKIIYPYLTYCYVSIKESLQKLLLEEYFVIQCEKWRSRTIIQNNLHDIYDGKIWQEFQSFDNTPFLCEPYCLALTINLDWFRPFKHSEYSIGAIYITIMNLPRNLRNKLENVILVGIIPGPSEPTNINGFLAPLVNELNNFWKGISLDVYGSTTKKNIRCALLCATCDLPAGRKLCGFLSYNAHQGCSRCTKSFTPDYAGFEREKWMTRSRIDHINAVRKINSCITKKSIAEIESKTGYRYTELLKLPYFNPTRMLAIDPMHNLFLGSGKHILKDVWIARGIISESNFEHIQNRIDKVVVPSDIGRIPHKIRSGFAAFTADQYKNWILYYSLLTLHDIVTGEDLECWRHFVLACRLLCQPQITHNQLKLADALLLQFCKRCERMYSRDIITPNMHMHAHLSECMLDFGPAHVFWLFSFERYNGILESLPNNNRSVEIQLIKRFMENSEKPALPQELYDDFSPIFKNKQILGTLSQWDGSSIHSLDSSNTQSWLIDFQHHKLPNFFHKGIFREIELVELKRLYSELLNVPLSNIEVPNVYLKYQQVHINGKLFGSFNSRSTSSSIILAVRHPSSEVRAAQVQFYAKHTVIICGQTLDFLLFHPVWFKPYQQSNLCGKPVTVWEPDCFELLNIYSYLPIQFIHSRTASLLHSCTSSNETVLLICPIVE